MAATSRNSSVLHPAQRFRASANIQKGVPLKRMFDRRLVELIAEAFAAVVPGFDTARFRATAVRGLAPLGLLERSARIAAALTEQLPEDFDEAGPLLIAALGPPLTATEGNGLAPFFYMPYAHVIAERGVTRFESGMRANYELTRRFTAEFSVRNTSSLVSNCWRNGPQTRTRTSGDWSVRERGRDSPGRCGCEPSSRTPDSFCHCWNS